MYPVPQTRRGPSKENVKGSQGWVTSTKKNTSARGIQWKGNTTQVSKYQDRQVHEQHKAATGRTVPKWWLLLDNQSTVAGIGNKAVALNHI